METCLHTQLVDQLLPTCAALETTTAAHSINRSSTSLLLSSVSSTSLQEFPLRILYVPKPMFTQHSTSCQPTQTTAKQRSVRYGWAGLTSMVSCNYAGNELT